MLAASPTLIVEMSDLTWRIVSNIAKPLVTLPPGELMYSDIGFVLSSESRKSITPITWFVISSSICWPR